MALRAHARPTVRLVVVASLLAGLLGAAPAVAAGPASWPADSPSAATKPVYDYATAVRQSVRVRTGMDTDADGVLDVVAVDLVRPRDAGRKVPVILDASPYYECCGRGNESQVKTYDANGVIASLPLFYDNYFVPRGYAVLGVDVLGTGRSTGCGDVGGPDEIASVVAVIDWLNGRATATDLAGRPVTASWSTGAVGMIGKSYDGTLANGVAATGVAGLKTIVPISAIDSWYAYTRSTGVPFVANYLSELAETVGRTDGVCTGRWAGLDRAADDASGSYTAFWRARDYTTDPRRITASAFVVHGVNDANVRTDHLSTWWSALGRAGVTRKLWLTQAGHVDPFDIRRGPWVSTLHRWFDSQLLGLPTGILTEPAVTVERSPGVFTEQASWPSGAAATVVPLGTDGLGGSVGGLARVRDRFWLPEAAAVDRTKPSIPGRLLLTSAPLTAAARLSGTVTVTLRVRADRAQTPLAARLVAYGPLTRPVEEGVRTLTTRSCWGRSTPTDSACYLDVVPRTAVRTTSVLARGWADAAHTGPVGSLRRPVPLVPGQWRTVTLTLRPQDVDLPVGTALGLALTLSDVHETTPNSTGATVHVDLAASSVAVPFTKPVVLQPAG